jgi:uncharacterized protein YbjT (DUF2867 family)
MKTKTIVVAGATGKTGYRIAENLLKNGHKVKALTHSDNEKSQSLQKLGAEILIGKLSDESYLTKALTNADGFYGLLPYNYGAKNLNEYQFAINQSIQKALSKADSVKDVIVLSSFGTHSPYPNSILLGLQDLENRVSSLNSKNVLIVRAAFFFENFLGMTGLAKEKGIIGGYPLEPSLKAPMISTNDIADYVSERFEKTDFKGFSIIHLNGPEMFSFDEAAKILGKSINKPELSWVNFGYEGAKAGMMQHGFSESTADAFVSFAKQANDNELWGYYQQNHSAATKTTLSEFTSTFKTIYNS